jgi:hypothetical protein
LGILARASYGEHLLTLMAVLVILQESSAKVESRPVRNRMLSYIRDNSPHFDSGKCIALLKAGVEFTARHSNSLALSFPQLAELATAMENQSDWSKAERNLREWRNRFAHLQVPPDPELNDLSDELPNDLKCLLETAAFISTLPLVPVADYELDPSSGDPVRYLSTSPSVGSEHRDCRRCRASGLSIVLRVEQ